MTPLDTLIGWLNLAVAITEAFWIAYLTVLVVMLTLWFGTGGFKDGWHQFENHL